MKGENESINESLFPYSKIRPMQDKFILMAKNVIEEKRNLVVHAPTGLGKTAASISPALEYGLEQGKKIIFLTSRHTQHNIVLETIREINKKYNRKVMVSDLIGKKHMCIFPGIDNLYSNEFFEFCKLQREEGSCMFFNKTKNKGKFTIDAKKFLEDIKKNPVTDVYTFIDMSREAGLCAYELMIRMCSTSDVIISDYNYIFNENIRDPFFQKIDKMLEDFIVIVDEAHNLPSRAKDMQTHKLSKIVLQRAIKEASKYGDENIQEQVMIVMNILNRLSEGLSFSERERKVGKQEFIDMINKEIDYDELLASLEFFSVKVLELQKRSYTSFIVNFLENWRGEDFGYLRMIEIKYGNKEPNIILSYKCLDPSIVTRGPINDAHSCIIMSGTLQPIKMFSELLGVENQAEMILKSPFPSENKINLIIPKTTTKYNKRTEEQFKNIAKECFKISENVSGNVIFFFPSYKILDDVRKYFIEMEQDKVVLTETSGLNKNTKKEIIDRFKKSKDKGACLFAVVSGSFGEGIDLPGDLLKGVVIVGLPLNTPDLETKSLIDYYDKKFSKGWEYGYVAPAFNKVMQNAGRCIRSEKDRGVIVFLDERYAWPNYKKYLPNDSNTVISVDYEGLIRKFFEF